MLAVPFDLRSQVLSQIDACILLDDTQKEDIVRIVRDTQDENVLLSLGGVFDREWDYLLDAIAQLIQEDTSGHAMTQISQILRQDFQVHIRTTELRERESEADTLHIDDLFATV